MAATQPKAPCTPRCSSSAARISTRSHRIYSRPAHSEVAAHTSSPAQDTAQPTEPCSTAGTSGQLMLPADTHTRRSLLFSAAAAASACSAIPISQAAETATAPIRPFCGVVPVAPPWAYSANWEEGTVPYAGFQTWYRALGPKPPEKVRKARSFQPKEPEKLPLLILHGGPGTPSRYLESLELLGATNRRLVFYDQIGCGKSRLASEGRGPGPSRLTPELFIGEVEAIRRELGLGRVHLLGHGWGGMLALAYLTQAVSDGSEAAPLAASGVASLTLLSTPPSWTALVQDRRAKALSLGEDVLSILGSGSPKDPAYQQALRRYQGDFVVRQQPVLPACVTISQAASSPSVAKAMTGGNLFTAGGALESWSPLGPNPAALQGLPTLVVRGQYEELSPDSTQVLVNKTLKGAKTQLLELPGAGTMVHIDASEPLLEKIDEHMLEIEKSL